MRSGVLPFLSRPHLFHELGKQTDTHRFDKDLLSEWASDHTEIDLPGGGRVEIRGENFDRIRLAKCLCTVVGGARRKDAKRNIECRQPGCHATNGAVAPSDNRSINRIPECGFPALLADWHVQYFVTRLSKEPDEAVTVECAFAGARIVKQRDLHSLSRQKRSPTAAGPGTDPGVAVRSRLITLVSARSFFFRIRAQNRTLGV